MHSVLGMTAGAIAFLAYVLYIVSILRGESKPSRVTWSIWTVMGLVLFLSYYFSGARDTAWVPLVEFVGPLLVVILSIWYGEGSTEDRTDRICLLGAAVSIALWIIFDSPVIALVTNLAVDAFALIPTVKKSYHRPEGENAWAWVGTGAADTLNLFAVGRWSFGIAVYPVYMLVSDLIVIGALLLGRRKKPGAS